MTDPEPLNVKRPADLPPAELTPIRPHRVEVKKPPAPDVSVPFWDTIRLYIRRRLERMTGDLDRGSDPGPILPAFLRTYPAWMLGALAAILVLLLILSQC